MSDYPPSAGHERVLSLLVGIRECSEEVTAKDATKTTSGGETVLAVILGPDLMDFGDLVPPGVGGRWNGGLPYHAIGCRIKHATPASSKRIYSLFVFVGLAYCSPERLCFWEEF